MVMQNTMVPPRLLRQFQRSASTEIVGVTFGTE